MTEQPKKLYLYCDNWQNGGVEAYLLGLLRNWDLSRMECTVLCAQKSTDRYDTELAALGVPLVALLGTDKPSLFARVARAQKALRHYLQENPADGIYLNLSNAFTMSYAMQAKRAGVPVRVVHSHSGQMNRSIAYPAKMLAHRLGRRFFVGAATELFACSELAAHWLFPENILREKGWLFVPNGIDTERFACNETVRSAQRKAVGLSENDFVLGTVGRMVYVKNQGFLLELMAALQDKLPAAKLLLVGDGPDEAALKARAVQLGVDKQVIFYGPSSEVPALLAAMDVFLLPSHFEGLPVSVVEAQAAGLPCLVSDAVTRQCCVSEHTSFLPISDMSAWVQAACEWAQQGTLSAEQRRIEGHRVKTAGFDAADSAAQVQKKFETIMEVKK